MEGQKQLKAALKPQAKAKGKAKQEGPTKKAYLLKKHKRKGKDGDTLICAIHDNSGKKQVCQLSSSVMKDAAECEEFVSNLVTELNRGGLTLDDVKKKLDARKTGSA